MRNIIDSHLDLAWNALSLKRDLTVPLDRLNEVDATYTDWKYRGRATISLPEMRKGRIAVGFVTMMARVPYGNPSGALGGFLDFPAHAGAYAFAQGQLAYYRQLEREGQMRIIRTAGELEEHWRHWTGPQQSNATDFAQPIGGVIAMEGTDAIVNPAQAETWYEDGLRCASLVHYGKSAYASGTGEEGPLTSAGRELLAEFERLGILLDTTHLCDTSFYEALEVFGGKLLASHQNCRELVPHQRQFSDEQLNMIIERNGVIGSALDAWMLAPGFVSGSTSREVVSINAVADHIDHVCQLAGNARHAAFGSDLDGGFGTEQCPTGLESIADLQKLDAILAARGYDDAALDAIFHGNWLRMLSESLPGDE
ncbi:MAG: peptidase [Planctomycetaceae bacterium]|nr:peptidase [Planctomycetaceae bacterium]MBP60867.1 peptidase [Planctomycetaceae bacterium]